MRRLVASSGLVLLAGSVPACLLYTDPINSAPKVTMIAPASVHAGEALTFRAVASDPDGDPVTVEWFLVDGKCKGIEAATWAAQAPTTGPTFEVMRQNHDPFCVRLVASDRYGATSTSPDFEGAPQNRPPVPTLTVDPPAGTGSSPLYTAFRLTAGPTVDDDGDDVTFAWKGADPQGVDMGMRLGPCDGDAHPEVRCFSADQPGTYTISVTASDGTLPAKPLSLSLPVLEDVPPCIEATDPLQETPVIVLAVTDHRNFEVRRVRDDGNPFPAGPHGGTTFQWSSEREGSPAWTRHLGFDRSIFEVSAALFEDARPGSSYLIRVEAHDPLHVGNDLRNCGEHPICIVPDTCVRWVTWNVRFQ